MPEGSDHHKTMSVLQVCHTGLSKELLICYIRDSHLQKWDVLQQAYLYEWMPEDDCKNAT